MPPHARSVPVATAGDGGVPSSDAPMLQPTGRAIWISPPCKPRDVTHLKNLLKRQYAVCPEPFSYFGSVCWNTTDNSFAGTKVGNYHVQAAGTSFSVLYQRDRTKDKDSGHLERMSICIKWVRQFCFVRKRSRSSSEITRVWVYGSNMKDTWAVVYALVWDISWSYGALGPDKALCLSSIAGHATSSNLWRINGVIQETTSTSDFHDFMILSSEGKEDRKPKIPAKTFTSNAP